ncbi:MAG: D-alanyl-D-alanine carboxypeptidase [Bradyrhizobium sp.]|nr:MAG: D-alanyl-D-alanine carboxypeptidase [Bradyrhizobium sp.]
MTLAFVASLALSQAAIGAENFQSAAPEALLIDYDSGATLYEKSADAPFPPAALVKLLTAEIVFNEIKAGRLTLDKTFTVSEHAWRTGGAHAHATAMFVDIHSQVAVEDLLRGLIVQSGNDAAITLAEGVSGSEDAFADLMNKRAAELALLHSYFVDPAGRDDPRQHVTARDMALLAAHIIRDEPDFYHYFGEKDFTWNKIHQGNRNPLLAEVGGADGLKTGEDAAGGFSLVGSAVEDGQRLIVVVAGLKSAADRAEEGRKLLEWGFRSFEPRVLYHPGAVVGSASVYGGEDGDVPLVCDKEIKVFLARGDPERLTAKIVYMGPLTAPVAAGAQVGTLRIWRGGELALEAPLQTQSSVAVGGLAKRAFDAGIEFAGGLVRGAMTKK